jgi:hypothetical protein
MAGFGPFDVEQVLKRTEFGGGAGLVEGSPLSQSGRAGVGRERISRAAEVMPVDEKIGVMYRTDPNSLEGTPEAVDPMTGLTAPEVL